MSNDLDHVTSGLCGASRVEWDRGGTLVTVQPAFAFRGLTAHPHIPWREMFRGVMGTVSGAVLVIRARAPQLLETDSH
jgi:hypothetical protein